MGSSRCNSDFFYFVELEEVNAASIETKKGVVSISIQGW